MQKCVWNLWKANDEVLWFHHIHFHDLVPDCSISIANVQEILQSCTNPSVLRYPTWQLTHWGRVMHICVSELTIIGSDNGLSPGRRQAIIWTNAGLLLIEPLGTNFSEISIGIQTFSLKKVHLNMSSAKWRPFCLGLNVLRTMLYNPGPAYSFRWQNVWLIHWGQNKMVAILQMTFSN